jgi:membrane protease YdiL (CAAX protease family)
VFEAQDEKEDLILFDEIARAVVDEGRQEGQNELEDDTLLFIKDDEHDEEEEDDAVHLRNILAMPRIVRHWIHSVRSFDKKSVFTVSVFCLIVVLILAWMPSGVVPTWLSDEEFSRAVRSTGSLSQLIEGILYVHQNYLRIAWYVGLRTTIGLSMLVILIESTANHLPNYNDMLVSNLVLAMGTVGRWSMILYVISLLLLLDVLTVFVFAAKHLVSSVGAEQLDTMSFASKIITDMSDALEKVLTESSNSSPKSVFSPDLFMPIGPPFGFHGVPGGFPGFPHHFHPLQHHLPNVYGMPYGFPDYGLFVTEEQIVDERHAGPPAETGNTMDVLLQVIGLLVGTLVIAPVAEELVFRQGIGSIDRLFRWLGSRRGERRAAAVWGQPRGVVIASLVFAAAHLNNHVPTPEGVPDFLKQGSNAAVTQLRFALVQFLVTFFLSIRVFSPLFSRRGLLEAMGAHFMWNACALMIPQQLGIRCLSWVAGLLFSMSFFRRETPLQ